jgi:DNA repair photolyase
LTRVVADTISIIFDLYLLLVYFRVSSNLQFRKANSMERTIGRGATSNPKNRFESRETSDYCDSNVDEGEISVHTRFYPDLSKSIIARNESPDVGFEASVNPYRGCEHGCSYCYARPTHEYLGFSSGVDFESRIMVKFDAAMLLRDELSKRTWQPQIINMSGVTDCYQPAERKFRITRSCLEVLLEFLNPVAIVTKNALVTRDIDILTQLASHHAAAVFVSITSLDLTLNRVMEPRTSTPAQRLEAIRKLSNAGIPVGVMVAPIIPGLNDHEIAKILEEAANAGARFAGYIMLRMPHAVAPLFERWLDEHYPDRKKRVLSLIRSVRGGKLSESQFGARMRGEGPFAEHIDCMFRVAKTKAGISGAGPALSSAAFRRPGQDQMSLF